MTRWNTKTATSPTRKNPVPTTVIIPAHGDAPHLPDQLASLNQQDTDGWDLIVADNGLTPHARAYLNSWLPRHAPHLDAVTRVIDTSQRAGKSYAVNRATAGTHADRLILLDADDTTEPDTIRHLTKALDNAPFVAGRLNPYTLNPPQYAHRRAALQHDDLHHWHGIPVAIGACTGIHRAAFDLIEGFDETLTNQIDLDLSLRLHAHGIRPVFCRDAVVNYRYRGTHRDTWRQETAYGRAETKLYARWRHHVPPRTRRETLRDWAGTAAAVAAAATPGGNPAARAAAVTRTAAAWGRARGSIENRVMYL